MEILPHRGCNYSVLDLLFQPSLGECSFTSQVTLECSRQLNGKPESTTRRLSKPWLRFWGLTLKMGGRALLWARRLQAWGNGGLLNKRIMRPPGMRKTTWCWQEPGWAWVCASQPLHDNLWSNQTSKALTCNLHSSDLAFSAFVQDWQG